MRIELASEAGAPDRANEDFALVTPEVFVVLDGVTPGPADPGCRHGVVWYVRQLGTRLLTAAAARPDRPLADCLADALDGTARAHGGGCDLANPATPQATMAVGRIRGDRFEYLVLADCSLIIRTPGLVQVVTDDRVQYAARELRLAAAALPPGSPGHTAARAAYATAVEALRNQEGGFWTAAADPAVAAQAVTGSVPLDGLRAVAAMSDGAGRYVEVLELGGWSDAMDLLAADGPGELLRQVRAAETQDPQRRRRPRGKVSDDATVVHACPADGTGGAQRTGPGTSG